MLSLAMFMITTIRGIGLVPGVAKVVPQVLITE